VYRPSRCGGPAKEGRDRRRAKRVLAITQVLFRRIRFLVSPCTSGFSDFGQEPDEPVFELIRPGRSPCAGAYAGLFEHRGGRGLGVMTPAPRPASSPTVRTGRFPARLRGGRSLGYRHQLQRPENSCRRSRTQWSRILQGSGPCRLGRSMHPSLLRRSRIPTQRPTAREKLRRPGGAGANMPAIYLEAVALRRARQDSNLRPAD
jgi:hypothetical protein